MLILFIIMIIYNVLHNPKAKSSQDSNPQQTECISCIPKPTPLLGNKQYY